MEPKENKIHFVNFENKHGSSIVEALEALLEKAKKNELTSIALISESKEISGDRKRNYGIVGFTPIEIVGTLTYIINQVMNNYDVM